MLLNAVTVRDAEAADADEVIALLEEARLESDFEAPQFVVATADGRIVACARLKPLPSGEHELASVAVAPSLQGRGLGARIVRRMLDGASTRVLALALAPGFFERLGFRRLDRTPEALAQKAQGACAGAGFVPMAWEPGAEAVRARYGRIALEAREAGEGACCSTTSGSCCTTAYTPEELEALPAGAHLGLGTGHPVREAAPQPGETVVDLGSGGGVDVFLAARAVGPAGRAIGIDFAPEMVALARANAAPGDWQNVAFHEAPIERTPLADASADVVISNCVINLSADKAAVLAEAHRILRPGGRFVASDMLRDDAPAARRPSCDCTTGALSRHEWSTLLAQAGFHDVRVEPTDDGRRVLVRARRGAGRC